MTVAFLRSLMNGGPSPVGQTQAHTLNDPGAKGKMKALEMRLSLLSPTLEMAAKHT